MVLPVVNYLDALALRQRSHRYRVSGSNSLQRFGGLCWTSSICPSGSWEADLCDSINMLVLWLLLSLAGGNTGSGLTEGPK